MRQIRFFSVLFFFSIFSVIQGQSPQEPPSFADASKGLAPDLPPGIPVMEEGVQVPPQEMQMDQAPASEPELPPVVADEPIADEPVSQVAGDAQEVASGPETLELPEKKIGTQGNWVKKKEWLKQTQEKNAAIQNIVVELQESRKMFFENFKPLDDELDDFYRQGGFDKAKIDSLFSDIGQYIEKSKKKAIELLALGADDQLMRRGDKYVDVYTIEEDFQKQKKDLDQLKLNMQALLELDGSIRTRLKALDEQISIALKESERARTFSEEIWYVIDDKKARGFYYDVDGINNKIQAIQDYVKTDLKNDFDSVVSKIREQIKKIGEEIYVLEEQGIVIQNREHRLAQTQEKKLEGVQLPTEQEAKKRALAGKEQVPEKKRRVRREIGWYETIRSFFSTIYAMIFGVESASEVKPTLLEDDQSPEKQV